MGLFSFFNKDSNNVEELKSWEYIYFIHKESLNWYAPKYVYKYNNYLIALAQGKFRGEFHNCSKYFIYEYDETTRETKFVKDDILCSLDKKKLLSKACKKVDDIILASEGF